MSDTTTTPTPINRATRLAATAIEAFDADPERRAARGLMLVDDPVEIGFAVGLAGFSAEADVMETFALHFTMICVDKGYSPLELVRDILARHAAIKTQHEQARGPLL